VLDRDVTATRTDADTFELRLGTELRGTHQGSPMGILRTNGYRYVVAHVGGVATTIRI
jgi:hypothetical protein